MISQLKWGPRRNSGKGNLWQHHRLSYNPVLRGLSALLHGHLTVYAGNEAVVWGGYAEAFTAAVQLIYSAKTPTLPVKPAT